MKWHFKPNQLHMSVCFHFKIINVAKGCRHLISACSATTALYDLSVVQISPSVYRQHLECCQQQLLIKPGVLEP